MTRQLLCDEASRLTAIDVLTSILLHGVPEGGFKSTARIPFCIPVLQNEDHCSTAVELAASLVTSVVNSDTRLAAPALAALEGEHGLDILIVLVREAAARLEYFAGIDGDTVDAYYAAVRQRRSEQ